MNMSDTQQTSGQWWVTGGEMVTLPLEEVRSCAIDLLSAAGAETADAAFIADVHLDKALQGDHERGLGMLIGQIRQARAGEMDLRAPVRVLRDQGATALVAGGPLACHKLVCRDAMALAVRKAKEQGIGCVGAQASGEILTPFIEQAVHAGMLTMVLAQSIPTVAPHGGSAPVLGNAPVGWGIPAGRNAPVIIDMSLTQTSTKGVVLAARQGTSVAPGLILDALGQPTTQAHDFVQPDWLQLGKLVARGSLTTLGASHKGYALVFIVGLLTSLLTGTEFPWHLGHYATTPRRFGTIFITFDPAAFGEPRELLDRVDDYIEYLRHTPRRQGVASILYPGERSQALKRERRASGMLTLPKAHLDEMRALSLG